ncbi:MAG: hypothetical protein RLZZ344_1096 [Pseudomonadota bacterium]
MKNKDFQDLVGGLGLMALGLFVVFYAQRYELGTLNRMGPGFFPVALGVILAILGFFIFLPALFRSGEKIQVDFLPLACVLGSLVAFALLLKSLGLVATAAIAAGIASLASPMSLRSRLGLAIGIAAITYMVFILGLSMVIPVWPWSA